MSELAEFANAELVDVEPGLIAADATPTLVWVQNAHTDIIG
ncbi:linaridin family RiPP [Streptomyces tubercidicus]|nr:linaridin family RiPP [Streptomyces tubercidicus]WSX22089.1 linaridin family RiPP [Streptomyces tubercidicus]